MFPDNQNNSGGVTPSQQYQPPGGMHSAPFQASNGQYEVVPPLPLAPNDGHSGHNPYEFIVNPATTKRSSLFSGNGSFVKRLALGIAGLIVICIVIAVVLSALGPKSSIPSLTAIAQRQQEIIRVATVATNQATAQDTQNFVADVQLSVTSSQQQTIAYLASHGTKLSNKKLSLDQSSQTDTLLANATTANTFDSAAVQTLTNNLQTYEDLLQTAYKTATGTLAKQILKSSYTSAAQLLKEAQRLPTNTNS